MTDRKHWEEEWDKTMMFAIARNDKRLCELLVRGLGDRPHTIEELRAFRHAG